MRAVVTGTGGVAEGLARALSSAGDARVVRLAVVAALRTRAAAEDAFAEAAASLGGPVDVLVHAAVDQAALSARPLADVDDATWDAVWEGTMQSTIACLQAAFGQMREAGGGRIVLVTPTLSMFGAAGFVSYAAAVEGQRILAKSAARQWGRHGITVNCVAPAPELVLGDALVSEDVSLAPFALGGPGDPEHDLGPVVAFLASDAGHFVTGATVCADGGVWMSP